MLPPGPQHQGALPRHQAGAQYTLGVWPAGPWLVLNTAPGRWARIAAWIWI